MDIDEKVEYLIILKIQFEIHNKTETIIITMNIAPKQGLISNTRRTQFSNNISSILLEL